MKTLLTMEPYKGELFSSGCLFQAEKHVNQHNVKEPGQFKWANCQGNHTANYRGCMVYRNLAKIFAKASPSVTQRVQCKEVTARPIQPKQQGKTYARTVKKMSQQLNQRNASRVSTVTKNTT